MVDFIKHAIKKGGWAPASVFLAHVFASKILDAYTLFPLLDIPMHFLGGVAICFFYAICLQSPNADRYLGKHNNFSSFILLTALTGTTTVL